MQFMAKIRYERSHILCFNIKTTSKCGEAEKIINETTVFSF